MKRRLKKATRKRRRRFQTLRLFGAPAPQTLPHPFLIGVHFAASLATALGVGFVFMHVGADQAGIQNRLGALFFVLLYLTLMSLSSLPVWREDRLLFLRERADGVYGVDAYFASALLFDVLPMRVLPPFFFGLTTYGMIGLNEGTEVSLVTFVLALVFRLRGVRVPSSAPSSNRRRQRHRPVFPGRDALGVPAEQRPDPVVRAMGRTAFVPELRLRASPERVRKNRPFTLTGRGTRPLCRMRCPVPESARAAMASTATGSGRRGRGLRAGGRVRAAVLPDAAERRGGPWRPAGLLEPAPRAAGDGRVAGRRPAVVRELEREHHLGDRDRSAAAPARFRERDASRRRFPAPPPTRRTTARRRRRRISTRTRGLPAKKRHRDDRDARRVARTRGTRAPADIDEEFQMPRAARDPANPAALKRRSREPHERFGAFYLAAHAVLGGRDGDWWAAAFFAA